MPPTSLERPGVRVVAPPSYDVRETPVRRGRSLPGEAGYGAAVANDSLISSLAESGFEQVQGVDLTPRKTRGLDQPRGAGGAASIDVDVAADEDAVVLMARDGLYSWHLPTARRERARSLEPVPHTAHFEIPLGRVEEPAPQRAGERTRGLLGDQVRGAAQAIIFRFAAPVVVGAAIERMEAQVHPGLVHIASPDLADWRPIDSVTELGLPTDRPVRVLLFVHGTFSSTVGGFGALALQENGRRFLSTAIAAYDAVLGFDHRTLSVDPRANARDLLERLSAHHSDHPMVLDIITHSRGGLTTRSFVESELPQSSWRGQVDTIVFVAATNAGTHLADPARWHDLVDLYTNLTVAGAGVLAALPGGFVAGAVVTGVIKGVGALVKYLVAYAGDKEGVPGLAAMVPEGPFVTWINGRQPGEPAPGGSWYVVSSNFHVSLFDGSNHPPEFPRELAARLGEGFVDGLFKGDNDLVVDTASMSAIGLPEGGGYVKDSLVLGSNDEVYHTNYFGQRRVIEAIAGWLAAPRGLGAGGGPEAPPMRDRELPMAPMPEAAPPMPPGASLRRPRAPRRPYAPVRDRELAMAPVLEREPPAVGAEPAPVGAGPPGPVSLTDARLAAEMPSMVAAGRPFDVRVILSRKEIQLSADAALARADVRVDAARPVSVHVVGKSNAEVVGADADVFGLPFGGGESELTFKVRALAKGPVAVHAVVRQGWVPIATLKLASTAVSGAALGVVDRPAHVELHPGIDAPELEGLPCLDIIESARPDGTVVYKYALRVEPGVEAVAFESAPLSHRDVVMGDFVQQVQELVVDDLTEGQRQRRLQDIGTKLFDLLFPEEMQEYLWAHRDRITDLLVYADEPYVPWEIVHLKPPTGNREKRTRFLAEGGLVRWRLGGFPPKQIRVRHGRARSLIPVYRDQAYELPQTVFERDYLTRTFEAKPVRATPDGVVAVLRSGHFDLLHFAGHGVADPEQISRARVLLQGRKRGSLVEPQYLTSIEVSENARWTTHGKGGPLVVFNACQTGRSGFLLSTAGGFADAFLDAGASAFISCLWSVGDQPSRTFVEKLYDELIGGTPMALATARARQEARRLGDATWLAYVVYARPDAVLVQ